MKLNIVDLPPSNAASQCAFTLETKAHELQGLTRMIPEELQPRAESTVAHLFMEAERLRTRASVGALLLEYEHERLERLIACTDGILEPVRAWVRR